MSKTIAAEGRESGSSFRLHPSTLILCLATLHTLNVRSSKSSLVVPSRQIDFSETGILECRSVWSRT
jgi:hypothetical protein